MKKIGIGIDYSNICKDYNTVYLDRDNTDPATKKCMKAVMVWTKTFVSELLAHFDLSLHHLSSNTTLKLDDVASKRFLFYSLEKEIIAQSYVLSHSYVEYASLGAWEASEDESILIENDEEGGSVYFFFSENLTINGENVQAWINTKLEAFSLDDVPFQAIK